MDPNLWRLLEEGSDEDEVAAIVRLGEPGAPPEGVRVVTRFGDIATVRLRRSAIPDVRASAEVMSMKPPAPLAPEPVFDVAPPAEGSPSPAHRADDRRPRAEPATGRGVVVGIIDFGCDFAHPHLRHPDGRTRLLALWDQSARPGAGNRYGYGVIHDAAAIDRALKTGDPYGALGYHPAESDPGGEGAHGTHVASIAAGNGRGGGPAGVAPEADLVFVQHSSRFVRKGMHRLGDSVTLLEAVDFVARTAGERPWVINISMGSHGGQHDGTTLVEQGLDAALRAAPGRGISQSAGNYYQQRCHTFGRLGPGEERTFVWEVDEADVTPNELEVWYSGLEAFVVELRSPDDTLLARAALGERVSLVSGGKEVGDLHHRPHEPNSLDNHIDVLLYRGAPTGSWKVTLIAKDVVGGNFHAWIERDALCPGCQSRFRPEDAVPSSTTGAIANGFLTVAVGAYDAHSQDGKVAPFSSCGPTRDDRAKPDLVAPGVDILAARSAPLDARDEHTEASSLVRMSGTSMASPHVAGTLALMFEAAPRPLRVEETRNLLLASACKAPQEWAERTGLGYLDTDAAIRAARAYRDTERVESRVTEAEDFEGERYPERADAPEFGPYEDDEGEPMYPEHRGRPLPHEENLDLAPQRADPDPDEALRQELYAGEVVREGLADIGDEEAVQEEPSSGWGDGYLVELAGEAVAAGRGPRPAGALVGEMLLQAGTGEVAEGTGSDGGHVPSAAEIFDAFAHGGRSGSRPERFFEVVAAPGTRIGRELRPGDLLFRRAFAEGSLTHVAMIVGKEAIDARDLESEGLTPESRRDGLFAQVLELGAFPHSTRDGFARRLADGNRRLGRDQMVLRLRPEALGRGRSGVWDVTLAEESIDPADDLKIIDEKVEGAIRDYPDLAAALKSVTYRAVIAGERAEVRVAGDPAPYAYPVQVQRAQAGFYAIRWDEKGNIAGRDGIADLATGERPAVMPYVRMAAGGAEELELRRNRFGVMWLKDTVTAPPPARMRGPEELEFPLSARYEVVEKDFRRVLETYPPRPLSIPGLTGGVFFPDYKGEDGQKGHYGRPLNFKYYTQDGINAAVSRQYVGREFYYVVPIGDIQSYLRYYAIDYAALRSLPTAMLAQMMVDIGLGFMPVVGPLWGLIQCSLDVHRAYEEWEKMSGWEVALVGVNVLLSTVPVVWTAGKAVRGALNFKKGVQTLVAAGMIEADARRLMLAAGIFQSEAAARSIADRLGEMIRAAEVGPEGIREARKLVESIRELLPAARRGLADEFDVLLDSVRRFGPEDIAKAEDLLEKMLEQLPSPALVEAQRLGDLLRSAKRFTPEDIIKAEKLLGKMIEKLPAAERAVLAATYAVRDRLSLSKFFGGVQFGELHLEGLRRLKPDTLVALQEVAKSSEERVQQIAAWAEESADVAKGIDRIFDDVYLGAQGASGRHFAYIVEHAGEELLGEFGRGTFTIGPDLADYVRRASGEIQAYERLMGGSLRKLASTGTKVDGLAAQLSRLRAGTLSPDLVAIEKMFVRTYGKKRLTVFLTEAQLAGLSRLNNLDPQALQALTQATDRDLRAIASMAARSDEVAGVIGDLATQLPARAHRYLPEVVYGAGEVLLGMVGGAGIKLDATLAASVARAMSRGKPDKALDLPLKGETGLLGWLDRLADHYKTAANLAPVLGRLEYYGHEVHLFARWALARGAAVKGVPTISRLRGADNSLEIIVKVYGTFGYEYTLTLLEELERMEASLRSINLGRLIGDLAGGWDKAKGASLTLDYAIRRAADKVVDFEHELSRKVGKSPVTRHYDLEADGIYYEFKYWQGSGGAGSIYTKAAEEFSRDIRLHVESGFEKLRWVIHKDAETSRAAIEKMMLDTLGDSKVLTTLDELGISVAEAARRLKAATWLLEFYSP